MKKTHAILFLFIIPTLVLAQESKGYRYNMHISGSGNSEMEYKPLSVGLSIYKELNKSFSISAGINEHSGFGFSEEWLIDKYKYHWDDFEAWILELNTSVRYEQKLLVFEKKQSKLSIFIEPKLGMNTLPFLCLDDIREDLNNMNDYPIEGEIENMYFFGDLQIGLTYYTLKLNEDISVSYDISYKLSSLDYFEAYRDLIVLNKSINSYLPTAKNTNGVAIGLNIIF